MKHLLLSLTLIISASAWADMDNICYIQLKGVGDLHGEHIQLIEENCERNNILVVNGSMLENTVDITALYCRYDRNVTETEHFTSLRGKGEKLVVDVTCVLYDNKRRGEVRNDI